MQYSKTSIAKSNIKPFNFIQLFIPVLIGLFVTGGLVYYNELSSSVLVQFEFTWVNLSCIILSVVFLILCEFGLIWRFRLISGEKNLSWKQAFKVNMLCEFSSAVTPSVVGGSGFIVLFLKAEGIQIGRGTAIMMSSLFLDELFFVIAIPIVFIFFSSQQLFDPSSILFESVKYLFIFVYSLIIIWTGVLYIALFQRPDLIKKVLLSFFNLPLLKRWRNQLIFLTDNLILSSKEISKQSFAFWIKAFIATILSWSCRYLIANALFLPFVDFKYQPLLFVRQLILWIVMVVSPTPGGSGLNEYIFSHYFSDMLTSSERILVITCLWRIISYYSYLIIGMLIIPKWLKNIYKSETLNQK